MLHIDEILLTEEQQRHWTLVADMQVVRCNSLS